MKIDPKLIPVLFLSILPSVAASATMSWEATISELMPGPFGTGAESEFHLGEPIRFDMEFRRDNAAPVGDRNGFKYVVDRFSLTSTTYSVEVLERGAIRFHDGTGEREDSFQMYSGFSDLTSGYGIPLDGLPLLSGFYFSSFSFYLTLDPSAFTDESLQQEIDPESITYFSMRFSFREPASTRLMGSVGSNRISQFNGISVVSTVPDIPPQAALLLGIATLLAQGHRKRASPTDSGKPTL